ncbi:MAG: ParA family protein [Planctomycetes bacterium]|nr:ParA family protein [Planctomycetota bacterium]
MHIISIINQKGGVGKTTSVANIGAAMAKAGHKVLLVDLDPQAHLSISFDRMPEPGDPSVYSLLMGQHSFSDLMQPTQTDGLFIAPTNLDLTGAESELAAEIGREGILNLALHKLSKTSDCPDVVLLDCPPSLGTLSLNALVASHSVIVPLQAEFFALQGMAQLLDVLERVKQRLNPKLELTGILVGMFSKQRNLSREVLQELENHFGEIVFPTQVRVNVRLAEAPSHGQTIFEYAPDSTAAEQFSEIASELAKRIRLDRHEQPQSANIV